ncbi:MAG: alpha/beta hydrolase [Burkholderiaceae bacterium]|jgi:pimeloyl-ACP methyl ester carboxylesterase|nr:alpha/beta hydrolase [Burkholderiaceae bacterium]
MSSPYVPRRPPETLECLLRGLRHHVTRWRGTDAEPVVLLHGWMDTGDTFQFLVDAMADRRSCIAPDWRGFGRSAWPADGYWFPDYFADLDALLDEFVPGVPVTLVGHSMGGNIATLYAGIRPERVHRVVCIEGFGLGRTQPEQAPGRYREWLRQLREPPEFANFPSLESFARFLERRNPRLTPERAAFIAEAWTAPQPDGSVCVRADPAHKRINPVLYRREEAEACWREITAPVLYVIGEQSDFLARLGADADPAVMARHIRRLEPCTVPDAGHMVHHEQPGRLAQAIETFLECG